MVNGNGSAHGIDNIPRPLRPLLERYPATPCAWCGETIYPRAKRRKKGGPETTLESRADHAKRKFGNLECATAYRKKHGRQSPATETETEPRTETETETETPQVTYMSKWQPPNRSEPRDRPVPIEPYDFSKRERKPLPPELAKLLEDQ